MVVTIYLCYGFDIMVNKMDTNGFRKDSPAVSMNYHIIVFRYLKNIVIWHFDIIGHDS